jgi:hypothetical protein
VKDNNYIVIQGWMVSRLKLTGNALMVYACIFGFSQNGEWFTGTAGYLADWCDCQKKYMLKLLKKMTDEGLLRKRTREQNGVAFCDYQAITPEEKDPSECTSQSAPPVHKVDPPGAQSAPHNIKDNIDTRVSKDTLVCANSGGFEAFWTAYPKKKSKGQALSAWKKLKPDSSLQALILKAVEAQKRSPDWQKDKGQYIPYPATWLNAMAWEDEMPAEQKRREVQYLP